MVITLQNDISFDASLLRDLQDEAVPLSLIISRILQCSSISRDSCLKKRLLWELRGFPKEDALAAEFGRLVKRAGLWESFFGPVEELERFIQIKEEVSNRESAPEPGGVYIGDFKPEFLDDEEEANSAKNYLKKLRRLLAEFIVEQYFILTPAFIEHFEWMI